MRTRGKEDFLRNNSFWLRGLWSIDESCPYLLSLLPLLILILLFFFLPSSLSSGSSPSITASLFGREGGGGGGMQEILVPIRISWSCKYAYAHVVPTVVWRAGRGPAHRSLEQIDPWFEYVSTYYGMNNAHVGRDGVTSLSQKLPHLLKCKSEKKDCQKYYLVQLPVQHVVNR